MPLAAAGTPVTLALTTVLLLAVVVFVALFLRARRVLDNELSQAADAGTDAGREAQSRFLIDNWPQVEQTARAQGMTDEQLAEVKRRLLENVT
jgi:hypothetical protein